MWSSESALTLLTHAANLAPPHPAPTLPDLYIPSGWLTAAFSMCMTSDSLFWVNLDQELLFPGHRYGTTDNAKFLTPLYLQLRSNPHERVPTLNIAFLNQPDKLNVLYSEGPLLPCSDICTCYRDWMKSISIARMLNDISLVSRVWPEQRDYLTKLCVCCAISTFSPHVLICCCTYVTFVVVFKVYF